VISRSHHNLLRRVPLFPPRFRLRHHHKRAVVPIHMRHPLKQPQLQLVMFRRLPVILQRLRASRLLRRAHHRQIPNLQQFRRREKHHVHRVVVNRIAQASLIHHQSPHPCPLRLHRASQPGRPRPNTQNVVSIHNPHVPRGVSAPARRILAGALRPFSRVALACVVAPFSFPCPVAHPFRGEAVPNTRNSPLFLLAIRVAQSLLTVLLGVLPVVCPRTDLASGPWVLFSET